MIIQCEQCSTKFRLDDSKVTAKGVKVRCAKCKHVFSVRKETADEGGGADFGTLLDRSADTPPPAGVAAAAAGFAAASTAESGFPQQPQEEPAASTPLAGESDEAAPAFGDDFDFGAAPAEPPAAPAAPETAATFAGSGEFDFGSFDFGDTDRAKPQAAEVPPEPVLADSQPTTIPPPDDGFQETGFDFGEFDFGDTAPEAAPDAKEDQESPSAPQSEPVPAEQGFDFGSDNLFGDAVTAPSAEEPETPLNFDFQGDFAEAIEMGDTARQTAGDTPAAEEPFSLGEIDFGDELTAVAVQQVNPEELKPGQDLLFAPLGTQRETVPAAAATPEESVSAPPAADEELPPLPISSRRKQGPLMTIISAVLGVAAAAAIGFYGYTTLKGTPGTQEAGRISLRSVNASYVKNSTSGDLLVISGEAVNDYKKPRASIQVRGMIYDASGKVLASRNAFGGNSLTPEQLATMPLEKIEAAMANQFGDSLANLEVAPGKAIPFVVVIPQLPAGGKEYGVEPAGSTVATKQ